MQEIIDLLENDARLTPQDIAAMTGQSQEEVLSCIRRLESDGVILKYSAIINREKLPCTDTVSAIIELQVTPVRGQGFPQVKTVQLISGGYDLHVLVEGKDLKEVALFVSEKLASLEGVQSTRTHFVLKTYKKNGTYYIDPKKDFREEITA